MQNFISICFNVYVFIDHRGKKKILCLLLAFRVVCNAGVPDVDKCNLKVTKNETFQKMMIQITLV